MAFSDIKVLLWHKGAFWGIPYQMRPGQQPLDILEKYRGEWTYLGGAGWYSSMTTPEMEAAKAFVAQHRHKITAYEGAWIDLTEED